MILGSETSSLPFGKHLDDSSLLHQSPISMRMTKEHIERYKKARILTRNKSNLQIFDRTEEVNKVPSRFSVDINS